MVTISFTDSCEGAQPALEGGRSVPCTTRRAEQEQEQE